MQFRTEIQVKARPGLVNHQRPTLLLGSCFSDSIGLRLRDDLFEVIANPTGTLYNPASIRQAAERIASGRPFTPDELFQYQGRWHSFAHHSRFSADTPEAALAAMNGELAAAREALPRVNTAIITLGSTHVFYLADNPGVAAANCHKLPAQAFNERDLSVGECDDCLRGIVEALRGVNPELRAVFTVSPIRHMAYGLEGNWLGKARLRAAIDEGGADYFPAYEIMMDDLRDYRFYAADMKHPSETAVDYIYEKFSDWAMDSRTREAAKEARRFTGRLRHRPSASVESRSFAEATLVEKSKLLAKYPEFEAAVEKIMS